MSVTPTFQGEVQMRRWSDSSTQGVQVTFALPDSSDLEPLKAKAGKRFMAVLVEIGDDEQPVQPAPRKDTRGPLCKEAQELCRTPEFQKWAARMMTPDDGMEWEPSESLARRYVLEACGVGSRKEFDTDAGAGERFIRNIRVPFMKRWQGKKDMRAAAPSAAEREI